MEQQLSLHLKKFNDRVKVLNQTNSRELILTALDARNLHAEIFELLTQISELTKIKKEADADSVITVVNDGGNF
jgi:hypothetical protein